MRSRMVMAAAGAAAAAMLIAGCSAGGGDDGGGGVKADSKGGAARPPAGGQVAPAPGTAEGGTGYGADRKGVAPEERTDMLSTFALDVDTASYGYARRVIADGALPAPATVRHEEFVNSFRQDYPEPRGNGFTVSTDGARAGESGWSLLRVGLATRSAEGTKRQPAALTFVVDVSGSMGEPGRLDLARKALDMTAGTLGPADSMAIVAFSDEARTVLRMTRADAAGKARIRAAVATLRPTDSTNLEAGVTRGYDVAVAAARKGATNRVVLLSDALANTGATDADTILGRIDDARREHGITLFGVGVGSDYGDALMERLTDRGDGHTSYVSDTAEAREVFTEQLPRNIELRARDAKAQVAFDPENVADFRLIGYADRKVADKDFRNDAVDGGEVGPGHTVTALYAVRLTEGAADGRVATATVRWLDPESRAPHERSSVIEAQRLAVPLWSEGTSERLRVDALAAYFADALRGRSGAGGKGLQRGGARTAGGDPLPGAPTVDALAARADGLAQDTSDPQVRQLADTVDAAVRLAG